MQFRTEFKPTKSEWNLDYKSKIVSIGSCFSTHIADRLNVLQFDILNNPYGTLYNPISIFRSLFYKAENFENTLIERDGMLVSYLAHSDLAFTTKKKADETIIKHTTALSTKLKTYNFLILTLGSAKIYKRKDSGLLVANCHKTSQNEFDTKYLELDEILEEFDLMMDQLNAINPDIKIILSVSPVRYLSDGFEMNSLSKSLLILACHQIIKKYNRVNYFPAYEIIMDDLRDYRFFNDDLLHPNKMAVNYVFDRFLASYCSKDAIELMQIVEKINKSLNHIPFNKDSDNYKRLLIKIDAQLNSLKNKIDISRLAVRLRELQSI